MNTVALQETQPASSLPKMLQRDLRLPIQLIAMARIGAIVKIDEAQKALETIKSIRQVIQSHGRPDLDLEHAQTVLQKISMGYAPSTQDCIASVKSLSFRLSEKSAITEMESPVDACEVAR